jgi:hypothetical protein
MPEWSPNQKLLGLVAAVGMAIDNHNPVRMVGDREVTKDLQVLRLRKPQDARLAPLRMTALILMTALMPRCRVLVI